ncbi:hypothetical protein [Rhodococcus sp. Q]|uniref:hypothetical protein n=1 Tax=Rhodococcus sp. Q TaxID=2502252 RepID=UPI0010F6599E|nr:hypothetical protein [Rhodococcus sp. Q]
MSKKPPIGASVWVATSLASDPHMISAFHATEHVADLLGIKGIDKRGGVREMAAGASEARAQVITFALVVAAMEARMVNDAWRSHPQGAADYLELLAANGHELTDVEKVIARHELAEAVAID